jgi:NtrC-family two-component system sensor histidine kinase KinB
VATTNNLIRWLIAAVGALLLLLNPPHPNAFTAHAAPLLIYFCLTALSVTFKAALTHGELSLAHGIGTAAVLSMPAGAQSSALWAFGLGVLIGEFFRLIWRTVQQFGAGALGSIGATTLARSGLGFGRGVIALHTAGAAYQLFGGSLPLQALDAASVPPLAALTAGYVGMKALLFALDTYLLDSAPRFTWSRGLELLSALMLPMPFAVLAGAAYTSFSRTAFALLIAALVMVIAFVYGISQSRLRLRRRVEEIEALAVLSEMLRAHMELKPLVSAIKRHVSALMGTAHVELALGQPTVDAERTLMAQVLQTEKALLLSARAHQRAAALGLEAPPDAASWLGVPLIAAGRLIGGLAVWSNSAERRFGQDDLRRLKIIAAGASIAIENAQREEEQARRVSQLAVLNQILALLSRTLSPSAVLDVVITSASALSDATGVTVYLHRSDRRGALTLARSAGFSSAFADAAPDPLAVELARTPQIDFGTPIIVSDVRSDQRAAHLLPIMLREGKQSWIELPLSVGDVGVGVLGLYFDAPIDLDAESVELLRTFANQAAQAISNAQLFTVTDEALERRVGQLLALANVGQELTALIQLQPICETVLQHALSAVRAQAGYLFLRGDQGEIEALAHIHMPAELFQEAAVALRPALQAAQHGGANVSAEAAPCRYALLESSRSVMIVPIQRGNTVFGALALESDQPDAFADEDSQFIAQLVNQAVIAIDNAHLFRRITEALDRMQVIVNAMNEALILIDANGCIALANPRVALLGMKPDELIGRSLDELLDSEAFDFSASLGFESHGDLRRLVKDLRGGWTERPAVKFSLGSEPDKRHFTRQIIPIHDLNGQAMGALLVFNDESERVRLEEAREAFSRMLIHDLRSPLTAITTSLAVLNTIIPSDAPYRDVVEMTTESSRRSIHKLLSRVNMLLDVARMESGQMHLETAPTELASLIDEVCIELSPLAHELNVKLESSLPDDLPPLMVDADKVERLLQNLVDNALKFSPLDGRVLVQAHPVGGDGIPPGFIRIDVIDQGPGVPDEYKTRLFERFAQISGQKGRRPGMGLGLTFCRMVAEAHGGRIWIEDNPTGGSVFAFTLPYHQNERADGRLRGAQRS